MMKQAFYMRFIKGASEALDRIGGLPKHLPSEFPLCTTCGAAMAFLVQFYSEPPILDFKGAFCVQLYQCPQVDEGCAPLPTLITLMGTAPENTENRGVAAQNVELSGIEWDPELDPDEIPLSPGMGEEVQRLYRPKAGGAMPFLSVLPPDAQCILQLTEYPARLNFGGLRAAIYRRGIGGLEVALV